MLKSRFSRRRDPKRLWDDSSDDDDDDEKSNKQMNIDVIDLRYSPEPIVSTDVNTNIESTLPDELPSLHPPSAASWPLASLASLSVPQQQRIAPYMPYTLQKNNSRRHSILPAFPTSFYNDQPSLLLANVPKDKLSTEQLARRQQGVYPFIYTINKKVFDIPSYFRDNYHSFMSSLIYQYNIDESILDYNLYRFSECFNKLANDYIQRHKYPAEQFDLNEKQKKYAFEFYLQIDVDIFFMKTCSFRNATPRSLDEGLFCINEPDIRYGFTSCNNCSLCVPPSTVATARRQQSTIKFNLNQKLRFINGYQTILNCPADCQTRNIIYMMTCPCNEFEYIGETSQRLGDRLWYHRQHFNRIIHEFLIGERNVQLNRSKEKDHETLVKDRMLLYKHAARCPSAIQIFLNFNPIYWCFIPITNNEAVQHSKNYVLPSSLTLLDSINPSSIASKNQHDRIATTNTRSDENVRSYIRHIPPIPLGYTFSNRQRVEQFQYFKNKLDIKNEQNEFLILFNAAIVAVLPNDASSAVRRFVESLFITHTEAKLNTSGQLLHQDQDEDDDDNNHGNIYPLSSESQILDRGEWCRNVILRHYQ